MRNAPCWLDCVNMAITERKLKNGKTVYDVRCSIGYRADGKLDRKSVTVRTKKQALIEESKMVAERDAKKGRSNKMTLTQYIDWYYWPITSKRLTATSLDTYEQEIRLRIKPLLGCIDIGDIVTLEKPHNLKNDSEFYFVKGLNREWPSFNRFRPDTRFSRYRV